MNLCVCIGPLLNLKKCLFDAQKRSIRDNVIKYTRIIVCIKAPFSTRVRVGVNGVRKALHMAGFLSKLLTLGEGKQMKNYQAQAARINELEPQMKALSDEELMALTALFKERFDNGEDLGALLPEAFAAVREASVRTIGLRHFDVQLIGGMALNDGQIAEMKTGEGKTLVSTLAGYLNALSGGSVILVIDD